MPPMRESGSLLVGLVGERLNLDSASRHPIILRRYALSAGIKAKRHPIILRRYALSAGIKAKRTS